MYDYTELNRLIDSSGKTRTAICDEIGVQLSTLSRSISRGSEMKHSTIMGLANVLKIKKAADIDRIFFTVAVDENQSGGDK